MLNRYEQSTQSTTTATEFKDSTPLENQVDKLQKTANEGDPEAQFQLGLCYLTGKKIAKSYKQSFSLFSQAAEQKHLDAKFYVAFSYRHGLGVKVNPKAAFLHFKDAASRDHLDALMDLSQCYQNGFGVEQNAQKAMAVLQRMQKVMLQQSRIPTIESSEGKRDGIKRPGAR